MQRVKSIHEFNLSELAENLKYVLELIEGSKLTFSGCCIYKVPPRIRKVNEEAYTPTVVSIGPYHHGHKRLKSMEDAKLWFLNKFLKRHEAKSMEDYVRALKNSEDEIRRCYSETIPMKSYEFVRMILIDACFIIEHFLAILFSSAKDNPWHEKLWPGTDIMLDLILCENQLPFSVLEELFDLTFPGSFHGCSFVDVAFHYVVDCFQPSIYPSLSFDENFGLRDFQELHLGKPQNGTVQVHHLCDMLRMFCSPTDPSPKRNYTRGVKLIYSATKLHEAGIVFQANKDAKSVVEVQYSKGVLKIPV